MGEKGCSHVQRMRTKDSAQQGWLSVATSFACCHAPWRVGRVRASMQTREAAMAEDKHFDVVVLGSGIAGLAAALAAQEHGLRVALVEKTDVLGGTSSDSYGLVWAGANHLLLADGQQDAREDIVAYMTLPRRRRAGRTTHAHAGGVLNVEMA